MLLPRVFGIMSKGLRCYWCYVHGFRCYFHWLSMLTPRIFIDCQRCSRVWGLIAGIVKDTSTVFNMVCGYSDDFEVVGIVGVIGEFGRLEL
jgi:hypothetical protein